MRFLYPLEKKIGDHNFDQNNSYNISDRTKQLRESSIKSTFHSTPEDVQREKEANLAKNSIKKITFNKPLNFVAGIRLMMKYVEIKWLRTEFSGI